MDQAQIYKLEIGGKEVTLETGKYAKSASGNVVLRCGDNVIMATATVSDEPRPGIDFFPLLIDYEEKMSSVGRIPGGFLKKEGRPSEKATLTCRLIDRPIRPLFPKGYRNDIQVVVSTLSSDQVEQPDTLGMLAASAALMISGAPFEGPIGAVRVSEVDGQLVANPTYNESENSDLDIIVSGTEDSVIMVEAGCNFVDEEKILAAVEFAQKEIKKQVLAQLEFLKQCNIQREEFVNPFDVSELKALIEATAYDLVNQAYHDFDRAGRKNKLKEAKDLVNQKIEELAEDNSIKQLIESSDINFVSEEFKALEKKVMRAMVVNEGLRADGRNSKEVRPIWCETGILPRTHGSAVFTRGNTQVLSVATLAGPSFAQTLEGVHPQTEKRYMHSYAFPAFSVGEVRPMRGPGRREIGHGALAERAILSTLPSQEEFGYAIRVTSDVIESNGSTSMASTCASCLALMDAGVPVKTVVGGVAMGLIKEDDKNVILTDIQGIEDFLGDMDFKVTGDTEGITALQMDMKIKGIAFETLKEALGQAKEGRLHIIDKMKEVISTPKTQLSEWAPKIFTMKIEQGSIGGLIGPGGKTIKGVIEASGATIDIDDSGLVTITSVDQEGIDIATRMVKELTLKLEPGMVAKGRVVRTLPIGAIVEIAPGKDGMVHISQIAEERVNKVEDYLNLGDEVIVKVMKVDERGRVNLTIRGVSDEEKASV